MDALPLYIIEHPDYLSVSNTAKFLLTCMASQYNSFRENNGDLCAAQSCMEKYGWSSTTRKRALKELVDIHNVQLRRFPDEVIARLRTFTNEVIAEVAANDPMSKKVYASYSAFQKNVTEWAALSEKMYYSTISS